MLRFEVLQAEHGDCFIMRWDDGGHPRIAVIDGGPDTVYANLRARLMALKGAAPELGLDWVMISHIDDDHINGLLAMVKELRDDQDNQRAAPFLIRRFWFNAFQDLAGDTKKAGGAVAALSGLDEVLAPQGGLSDETQAILASVGQGRGVRDALDALSVEPNQPKGGLLTASPHKIKLDGLDVTVVGPLEAQLEDLRKSWQKPKAEHTAETASYTDTSVANLSSLVCHVARGTGANRRTLLLTGDARGDYILEGLDKAGLLRDGKLGLDLLKVQHHGSDRDVVKDFFARVTAKHYVISANGKYSNPDPDTLKWLIEARGSDNYVIHLSNRQEWMPAFFAGLQAGRNFQIVYRGELADKTAIDEIILD